MPGRLSGGLFRILVASTALLASLLLPSTAMADRWERERERDRHDHCTPYNRGDRFPQRDYERGPERPAAWQPPPRERSHVAVDVQLGNGLCTLPVIEERQTRVWVEPVYRTVCDRVWVEPVYRATFERVWHEPVYREEFNRVWVPDRWEIRHTVVWDCDRRVVRQDRVLVEPAHFAMRPRRILVCAGRWETVERRELVCEGHWKTVEHQELVSPGRWEVRTERVALTEPRFREESFFNFRVRF
jgi:hypothetical protein